MCVCVGGGARVTCKESRAGNGGAGAKAARHTARRAHKDKSTPDETSSLQLQRNRGLNVVCEASPA